MLAVVALSSGVTVSAGLVLLCYRLCCGSKPSWQTRPVEEESEYIPIEPLPVLQVQPFIDPIQPEPYGEDIPLFSQNSNPNPNSFNSSKLSTIPENNQHKPPNPKPLPPTPRPSRFNPLSRRKTELDLEVEKRYAMGKVAELEMWILFRDNVLEMTIKKIDKIHSSINKKEAYVRVKNPRERKMSVPMLRYSNDFQALLGSHNFKFNMTKEQLQTTVFRFYLWSVDCHSRQKEFGEFALDFKEVFKRDLSMGFTEKYDFLVYDTKPQERDPSIRLKLKYHCKSGKMIVSILEIRDLDKNPSAVIQAAIYVKVLFVHNLTRVQAEYRTKHVKGQNPQFHTTFNHKVQRGDLEDTTMYVQIKARTVHTDTLSVLEFSSDATGRLGEHWTQMIQGITGGYGVEMTHRISQEKRRPLLLRRLTTTTLF